MVKAPLKQSRITHRHENARTAERGRRSDECHQFAVGLAHRVSKEGKIRGIARDPALMLHDARRSLLDRIEHFAAAVMAVDEGTNTNTIASLRVFLRGPPHAI